MSIKLITGNIGSGKTEYCINKIRELHEREPKRKCIMLVPSHYTHETEKLITDIFGGTGLNNIEVTSFEKLARELLSQAVEKLASPGKTAIICRAIELTISALKESEEPFDRKLLNAVQKQGFVDVAKSLLSELHRYMISGDLLCKKAEQITNGTLKQKLYITALISDNYDQLLENADFIDSDEDLVRLAGTIKNEFKDCSIWMDKFDELLPQQFEVLCAIMDCGADVTITFNTCGEDTYYGTTNAIEKICDYTKTERIELSGSMEHVKSPDLKFLFRTWFDRSHYAGKVENTEVFEARDAYTEVEHTAGRILDLVREEGYRFKDITVICGDADGYSHIIEAVFSEYDIPYYSDETFSIASHPIAIQVLSLFDIIESNWSYSAMLEYLRAGFVYIENEQGKLRRIAPDKIDELENYVLRFGIRGERQWSRQWTKNQRTIIDEALAKEEKDEYSEIAQQTEDLRGAIVKPILKYTESAKKAKTVTDYCRIVYEFLEDINLYAGLKAELLGMAMNQATADAQRFGQIWNLILEVLNQLSTALGDCEVSSKQFYDYLQSAMGECSIRTIPSGVDRVFIGSVEKNRSENSKVIFAIGAVSGTFPSESTTEGFLSNADRSMLGELDIKLAPTTKRKSEKQYNNVYKTLSSASEKLLISYPVQTPDSRSCRMSQLVIDIISKLPGIRQYDDIILTAKEEQRMYISSPAATMHKLLIHHEYNPLWTHVSGWFSEHEEWRHKLFSVEDNKKKFGERNIKLTEELAAELYPGVVFYSPTHLNVFSQCPFKNFLQYGLHAKEREVYEISAADSGTYAHEIVHRFCESVDKLDINNPWKNITDEQCESIVDKIVKETIEHVDKSEFSDKEKMSNILNRMGRTVKEVSKTVRGVIAVGDFRPSEYETKIKGKLTDSIELGGTIDRLDKCEHDGINEYRIIDYKTGKKDFSVADICEGAIDMQPVIYALLIQKLKDNSKISGMYYSKMRNDFADVKAASKASTIENELRKNTELKGVTFADVNSDGSYCEAALDRIDSSMDKNIYNLVGDKGNLHSTAVCGALMDRTCENIIGIDKKIRAGDIEISPIIQGTNSSVCDYCDYAAVCRFDESCKKRRHIEKKDAEVWAELEGEEE